MLVGAFILPYLICVVIGGVPMFFLEVAVGQYMRHGGIKAWQICPIFQGKKQSITLKNKNEHGILGCK